MTAWWASLSVLSKILWGVTLSATLVFIIQSVLTFIGADVDSAADFDVDASDMGGDLDGGINLYTFRNFINFILGFGWTAILLKDSIKSKTVLIIVAALVGVALVAIVMYLFKLLASMQQSGNIDVAKMAVGCTGKVYIPIPAERGGTGKVQITISNAVREYIALTDGDAIKTDTPIKVVEVLNDNTLLVEELNSLIV
ncbi:MAG: NfeD family protein [Bacteroidales bacterium]|nr:NfeD family protein [Bacteroidales bacterium]